MRDKEITKTINEEIDMPAKKKTAEKKAATKKTTAKKAAPVKKAAVKKTTAKKAAPVKKAVAKKTTAKKAAPVKKAVAKKTTAKKATPVKKAVAKKTTAKKAAPVKKAAAKKIITKQPKPKKPSVSYPKKDLVIFEKVINDAREEAIDELRMLKERLDDLTNYDSAEESMIYSMHMAEQGSEAIEKEKTYAQLQRINDYIKKLDDALFRINEGTYGVCRMCECLIARERLMAVPITTLSASYKIHQKCPDDGIDKIEAVK